MLEAHCEAVLGRVAVGVALLTLSVAELSAQLTLIISSFAAEKKAKESELWMAEEAMWRLILCIHLVLFPTKIPSSR